MIKLPQGYKWGRTNNGWRTTIGGKIHICYEKGNYSLCSWNQEETSPPLNITELCKLCIHSFKKRTGIDLIDEFSKKSKPKPQYEEEIIEDFDIEFLFLLDKKF